MSKLRYQGAFVSDRVSADACIDTALNLAVGLKLIRNECAEDDYPGAFRLHQRVQEIRNALRGAEKLLEQRMDDLEAAGKTKGKFAAR